MKNRASQRGYTLWELIFTFTFLALVGLGFYVVVHFITKFW